MVYFPNIIQNELTSNKVFSLTGAFHYFVRTDGPDHSCCNENFTLNQSYPATLVKC